jgi:predicted ATP-dependent endonuclease of OLD family
MNIILKKISLSNFKGIRSLEFDFAGGESTISGANGSGKTSIFDGFTWCLFGKDSEQNAKFSVATLDESGAIISGLTHTVQVVLDVDGTEMSLERTQEDKKGGASTCTYAVDGFKKLKKEFDEIVSNLCPEQLFKAITNPYYFNSLKWQDQRAFLMSLCDLTKIEVSPEFQALLDKCKASNVSLTDYQKKLATDIKTQKNR